MTAHIRMKVPPAGTDLKAFFEAKLKDSEFRQALDLDVEEFDERAVQYDLDIAEVLDQEDFVEVAYYVHWDAYYGCSDANLSGRERRETIGELDGDAWLFPIYIAPPKRTPFEEF